MGFSGEIWSADNPETTLRGGMDEYASDPSPDYHDTGGVAEESRESDITDEERIASRYVGIDPSDVDDEGNITFPEWEPEEAEEADDWEPWEPPESTADASVTWVDGEPVIEGDFGSYDDPSPDYVVPGEDDTETQTNETATDNGTEENSMTTNPAWEITEDPSPDYIDPSSDDPQDRTTTWGDSSYLHLMEGEEPSDILGDDWQQDMEDMNPTSGVNGAALSDAFNALNARLAALENSGSGSSGLPRLGVVAAIVGGIALVAGAVFD